MYEVGDVDSDGLSDYAIAGSIGYGQIRVFSGVSGLELWRVNSDWVVSDFASARDFNGDGIGDAMLGNAGHGPNGQGAIYIYGGSTGALITRIDGEPLPWVGMGRNIASLGDINGDGYGDVGGGCGNWGPVQILLGPTGELLRTAAVLGGRELVLIGPGELTCHDLPQAA